MKRACLLVAALLAGAAFAAGNTASPPDAQKSAPATRDMSTMHPNIGTPAESGDIKVPKATGPDARTVAEIVTGAAKLDKKTVVVRAKVVKFTPEVMGKNWMHVRDGSGKAADNTNDVLISTKDSAKVGDVVLVRGVVRTNVDIGAGYFYKVLVEDASLQK